MNKEQNIDDILKLLKNSYDNDTNTADPVSESADELKDDISHDELQLLLKQRFVNTDKPSVSAEFESDNSFEYKIDEEFLIEESVEESLEEEIVEEVVVKDEAEQEELFEDGDGDENDGLPPFDLEEYAFDEEEETAIPPDVLEALIQPTELEETEESLSVDIVEKSENAEAIETVEFVEDVEEECQEDAEDDHKEEFFSNDSGQLALFEDSVHREDYESDDESASEEEHFDENQIVLDFGDVYDGEENVAESFNEPSNIDASFLGLMLEFGDKVAIGKNVSTERIDIYNERSTSNDVSSLNVSEVFGFEGDEYVDPDQADDVIYSYQRDKKFTFLRLLGCGAFSALIVLFELLPHLPIKLSGILDHSKYPTVYLLLGIQLLVFAGAFAWRELWAGLKKAFCFKSELWSVSALVTAAVLLYQTVLIVLSPDSLPMMFGSFAAIYIFIGMICEYLKVCRELKSFEVYSCDSVKYTFETEPLANSAAEKMYRGGVSSKVNIFEPREVSFPNGYFSEVNSLSEPDMLINCMITPIILVSAALWIVSMMLEVSLVQSLEIFILSLTALSPSALFASRTLPLYIASSRLYERESAIASEVSARKYASCDIMIFRDSHLFRKSRADDNGIVIYDEKNTKKIISYLNALYDAIGGPMKEIFAEVGDKYEPKLRRIARNGVEAVINKQSVILGDIEFQHRYGISFPDKELQQSGEGILCLSIDGVPSAKLCLRYRTEPIFEMIVSKMEENGIKCAIETYDPVINSVFVATSREDGAMPINVVHKNVTDYYSEMPENVEGNTGLVACSSRLKLVECVVWCKKIFAAKKACFGVHIAMSVLTLAVLIATLVLGVIGMANQYWVMLLQLFTMIPTLIVICSKLPPKRYFAVEENKKKQRNREDTNE